MGSDGRVLLWPRRRRSQANQLEEEKLAVQQQETDNFVYPNQDRAGDRRGRLHRQPRRAATARRGLPRRCRRQPRELLRARRSPGNTRGTSPSTRCWPSFFKIWVYRSFRKKNPEENPFPPIRFSSPELVICILSCIL
ncbi:uncharacterized protein LOC123448426 isoform X1 [Hordeum vulgare subsp. vulgare]|uniref:uncharacterized protein LOC123448426 isoform X1 n=1 Tax=Hordeum vulgare subsp. vulgare TaxID=112509 RepID=UPI001D1A4842|nr:uncharacterized protein LOC123448426 isoform X1 [Hordeum vulgare subsp. vulgare]